MSGFQCIAKTDNCPKVAFEEVTPAGSQFPDCRSGEFEFRLLTWKHLVVCIALARSGEYLSSPAVAERTGSVTLEILLLRQDAAASILINIVHMNGEPLF
jgi:hypothetical protein